MSASRVDPSSDKFERANVVQTPTRNPKQISQLKEEYWDMLGGLNLVSVDDWQGNSLTLDFLDENEAWSEEILS
jgi:hypothetical protein